MRNNLPFRLDILKCPVLLCLFFIPTHQTSQSSTFDVLADFITNYNDVNFKAIILVGDNFSLEDCELEPFCKQVLTSVADSQKFPDVLVAFAPMANFSHMLTHYEDTKTLYIFVGPKSGDNFMNVITEAHPVQLADSMWLLRAEETKDTLASLEKMANIALDSQVYVLAPSMNNSVQLIEIYRVWWDR